MRSLSLSRQRWDAVIVGLIALVSGALIMRFGKIGFHLEDLSVVFDGGFRLLSGQLPLVDFVAPIGPVSFALQAVFFGLLGVSLNSFLLAAAILNGVAVVVAYDLLRRIEGAPALLGAAVTAAWFYLPPGAPYMDTTAFLFGLLGLWCIVRSWRPDAGPSTRWLLAAGLMAGLSLLSKQNIGVYVTSGLGLVVALSLDKRVRSSATFVTGVALALGAYLLYASVVGGLGDLWHYAVVTPLRAGRVRSLVPEFALPLVNLVRGQDPLAFSTGDWNLELFFLFIAAWTAIIIFRGDGPDRKRLALVLAWAVGVQYASRVTSGNNWSLYYPYNGLVLASVVPLLLPDRSGRRVLASVMALLMIGLGLAVGFRRDAHDIERAAATYELQIPRLRGLKMDQDQGQALDEIYRLVAERVGPGQEFFVYPQAAVLYGASGKASSQPLLWFRGGVSYDPDDPARTQAKLIEYFREAEVKLVILGAPLHHFPEVRALLDTEFRAEREIGELYDVYRREAP